MIFVPKYWRKTLHGQLRRHLGEVFRKLAVQKESRIEEGHLMPDHVHILIAIPPKYAVSQVIQSSCAGLMNRGVPLVRLEPCGRTLR